MENLSLNEKKEFVLKLKNKYPDRVPVIIEKSEHITLKNYKYLLPKDIPISVFLSIIRTKMNITKNQAIFTFVNSAKQSYNSAKQSYNSAKQSYNYILVPMNETIETIYTIHKSEDNFLYVKFGIENTFG